MSSPCNLLRSRSRQRACDKENISPVSGDSKQKEKVTFLAGEKVRALREYGNWQDATIAKVNRNGTFRIDWEDGEKSDTVKRQHQLEKANKENSRLGHQIDLLQDAGEAVKQRRLRGKQASSALVVSVQQPEAQPHPPEKNPQPEVKSHCPEENPMAQCNNIRCARCLSKSDVILRCQCGFAAHGHCTYPVLSQLGVRAAARTEWTCEFCAQEKEIKKNYEFCIECGMSGEHASDLMKCTSCRGSFHARCIGLQSLHRVDQAWHCPQCAPKECDSVELDRWCLELVKSGGRWVGAVRGVRRDVSGPPGTMWRTAEIVHVITPRTLRTRTGAVVILNGNLGRGLANKLQIPTWLLPHFSHGFPLQTWMLLIKYAKIPEEIPMDLKSRLSALGQPASGKRPGWFAESKSGSAEDFDWIGDSLLLPHSRARLKQRPEALKKLTSKRNSTVLHEANNLQLQVHDKDAVLKALLTKGLGEAINPAEHTKKPSGTPKARKPLGVGLKLRRIFQDGGFYGHIEEVGSNGDGQQCILIAYDDGRWERIATADVEGMEMRKVLRLASTDGDFGDSEDEAEARPKKRGRKMDIHCAEKAAASWSTVEKTSLRTALKEIRPNTPGYWQFISLRVGRTVEECQACVASWKKLQSTPLPPKGPAENPVKAVVVPEEMCRQDGPRRAKQVYGFVSSQSYHTGNDFLTLESKAEHNKHPQPEAATPGGSKTITNPKTPESMDSPTLSPGFRDFLGGLHTGLSPQRGEGASGLAAIDLFGDAEEDDPLGDIKGPVSRPIGLESFVCDIREKRNKAERAAARYERKYGHSQISQTAIALPNGTATGRISTGVKDIFRNEEVHGRKEFEKDDDAVLEDEPLAYWSEEEENGLL